MFRARIIVGATLAAAAMGGCGSTHQPLAGTPAAAGQTVGHARVDDPRTAHLDCIRQHHLQAVDVGQTEIQVGAPPGGPKITFTPTAGAAQSAQISGNSAAAEVIGSALLYPNQAPDDELKLIEDCLAQGVSG
jgi:hypothetical protein